MSRGCWPQRRDSRWSFYRECNQDSKYLIFGCTFCFPRFRGPSHRECQFWSSPYLKSDSWVSIFRNHRFSINFGLWWKYSRISNPDGEFFDHEYTSIQGTAEWTTQELLPLRVTVPASSACLGTARAPHFLRIAWWCRGYLRYQWSFQNTESHTDVSVIA